MQTFMPYFSFGNIAACLDYKRLGKQRSECKQILRALGVQVGDVPLPEKPSGWMNHPAVRMWRGHELSLCEYAVYMCDEWIKRGYVDNTREQFIKAAENLPSCTDPAWIRDEQLRLSHRSNLIRKLPEHYGPMWPDVPNDLPYVWPV